MGINTADFGAPSASITVRNDKGHICATVRLVNDGMERYDDGFIDLLRPNLYKWMLSSISEDMIELNNSVTKHKDTGQCMHLKLGDGSVINAAIAISADGIDSTVRTHLWDQSL